VLQLVFGELLQSKDYALKQIRSVHSRLKCGKGLSAINHQIWELIDKERENPLQKPTLYQFWLWAQETMSTKTTAMAAPGVAGLQQLQEALPSRRCALSVGQKQERSPLRSAVWALARQMGKKSQCCLGRVRLNLRLLRLFDFMNQRRTREVVCHCRFGKNRSAALYQFSSARSPGAKQSLCLHLISVTGDCLDNQCLESFLTSFFERSRVAELRDPQMPFSTHFLFGMIGLSMGKSVNQPDFQGTKWLSTWDVADMYFIQQKWWYKTSHPGDIIRVNVL